MGASSAIIVVLSLCAGAHAFAPVMDLSPASTMARSSAVSRKALLGKRPSKKRKVKVRLALAEAATRDVSHAKSKGEGSRWFTMVTAALFSTAFWSPWSPLGVILGDRGKFW